jgi:integrase
VYQAQLLQAMMRTGNLNQDQLAAKVGKDKGLISKYLSLMSLAPQALKKLNAFNLTLRQALEVARLASADQQIAMAEECLKTDLAGKALKERVDKLVGNSKNIEHKKASTKDNEEITDPLYPVWLQAMSSLTPGSPEPEVHYYKDKKWTITIPDTFQHQQADLAQYLASLAEGVRTAMGKLPDPSDALSPELKKEVDIGLKVQQLPQSPQDWQEIEALAHQSPAAAYAWIYGTDHPRVMELAGKTWKDLDIDNPMDVIHTQVDSIELLKKG